MPPTTKQRQSSTHATQRGFRERSPGYGASTRTCVGPATRVLSQLRHMGGAPRSVKGLIRRRPGGK